MGQHFPSLSEVSDAYDQRFAQGTLRESESFYRWVLRRLDPSRHKALLDVSCGEGHLLHWASRLYDTDGCGVDLSRVALLISHEQLDEAGLARCDGIALPFADCSFDYVTNLGSLEHYADIPLGIREMARVLRPGGRAAILLPNSYYLADIVWQVMRTGYGPSHQQPMEQFATAGEWRDLLEEGGLEPKQTHPYNFRFPFRAADWQWYRGRPRRFLNLLISPFVPFHLSYCFLFICQRATTASVVESVECTSS
jgi:ubiquinone/menaquinone biosynthesis C-methylase UbiE